jgi:(p)ppGpp synthase/HD superfamily hydrolase
MTEFNARKLAIHWHADQKYGNEPYIKHLDAVADLVKNFGGTQREIDLAYLHDILEDTAVSEGLIPGGLRADLRSLTDSKGANRRERKRLTYERWNLQGLTPSAALVKVCDRIANMLNCIDTGNTSLESMYRKEMQAFLSAVKANNRAGQSDPQNNKPNGPVNTPLKRALEVLESI